MPSAFAHAFVGAALASAAPRRRPRWVPLLFAALAASPDLDVIGFRLGIPYAHPLGHRGLSHSLFFAVGIGFASWPLWRIGGIENAGRLGVLTFAAVASHGLLDAFTDAGHGIGLLLPFDETRYFAPWRPILTSPLSVSAFFDGAGLRILSNELRYVGLPTCAALAIGALIRRWRSTRARSS